MAHIAGGILEGILHTSSARTAQGLFFLNEHFKELFLLPEGLVSSIERTSLLYTYRFGESQDQVRCTSRGPRWTNIGGGRQRTTKGSDLNGVQQRVEMTEGGKE